MDFSPSPQRLVKSWFGLGFGLACVTLSIFAWLESNDAAHLVSLAAFACWSIAWSQLSFSFKVPLREQLGEPLDRVTAAFSLAGFVLVCISMAIRWLL